ncbi:hypothetical protein VNO77_23575 [Canavalia gladiata]|uniref:Uncharacterized protein n=1 Tax=Canavalia gladiata TaxID=3824 RepID=A0AAN9L9W7_CANGL
MMLHISGSQNPLDLKNSIFGWKCRFGSVRRNFGTPRIIPKVLAWEKPRLLKNSTTASGFARYSKLMRFKTVSARCGENPQVAMRYETVKEFRCEGVQMNFGESHRHWWLREKTSFRVDGEMVLLTNLNMKKGVREWSQLKSII